MCGNSLEVVCLICVSSSYFNVFVCFGSYYVIIPVKWLDAIVAPSIGLERGRGVLVFMV